GSLFGYSDNVDVNFEELSRNGVEGGFIVSSGSLINMYSYDSFSFKATNIYDSFNLPTTSRYGMRSAKLSSLCRSATDSICPRRAHSSSLEPKRSG
ncbi:MAG: hypothetical protein R6V46_05660, partial [Desulfatiglandaceae bacterium]